MIRKCEKYDSSHNFYDQGRGRHQYLGDTTQEFKKHLPSALLYAPLVLSAKLLISLITLIKCVITLKGPQEPKSDNPEINSACEPWNSTDNKQYRTLTLSGGAPLFIMCLCLQSRKDVSCSMISLSIPCR